MPAKGETNTKGKKDTGGIGIRDYEEIGRGGGGGEVFAWVLDWIGLLWWGLYIEAAGTP